MPHLDEEELVDALDGQPNAATATHLGVCRACEARVLELRTAMQTVLAAGDEVIEPAPAFWDHFPRRVGRALDDAQAQPRGWFYATRWVWGGAVAAVLLFMMLLPLRDGSVISPPDPAGANTPVVASGERAEELDSFGGDEAWALVRAVAEDLDYDDVREAGLIPRAGSVERAAVELSGDERAELARLIEQELKRAGASIP